MDRDATDSRYIQIYMGEIQLRDADPFKSVTTLFLVFSGQHLV